jgi:hypothetical protein
VANLDAILRNPNRGGVDKTSEPKEIEPEEIDEVEISDSGNSDDNSNDNDIDTFGSVNDGCNNGNSYMI